MLLYRQIFAVLVLASSVSGQFLRSGPDPRDGPKKPPIPTQTFTLEVEHIEVWTEGPTGQRYNKLLEQIDAEKDPDRRVRLQQKLERLEEGMPRLVCGRRPGDPDVPVELHVEPPRSRALSDAKVGDVLKVECAQRTVKPVYADRLGVGTPSDVVAYGDIKRIEGIESPDVWPEASDGYKAPWLFPPAKVSPSNVFEILIIECRPTSLRSIRVIAKATNISGKPLVDATISLVLTDKSGSDLQPSSETTSEAFNLSAHEVTVRSGRSGITTTRVARPRALNDRDVSYFDVKFDCDQAHAAHGARFIVWSVE